MPPQQEEAKAWLGHDSSGGMVEVEADQPSSPAADHDEESEDILLLWADSIDVPGCW